ncbi:MAG: energy-coupling factor ABC transporter ATP-binding protein [Thermanaerothrix sp.]|nr:energy-coupling factor ABC transporter ATP-binding protein [Thermanaerothrix sp.]
MTEAAIEISHLTYIYPPDRIALHEICLRIAPGEHVALVGPNGAGKSTLLRHLNGLLRGRGEVRVLGTPLTPQTVRWVRHQVGLVFQAPQDQLFCPTVFEDVAYAPLYAGLPPAEVEARAWAALDQVGMRAHATRSPFHLSLGEQKRVALATVLVMQPAILALDEPTAGLDPRGRRELITLLQTLPQTLILATHDLDLVRQVCPRTVVLDGGVLVADGPTARILGDAAFLLAHGLA